MEPGELEHRKAFEETATKNIRTIGAYTNDTRVLVRDLSEQVKELKNMLATRDTEVIELRRQVSLVQAELYNRGTH
jgi:hypothetical protein